MAEITKAPIAHAKAVEKYEAKIGRAMTPQEAQAFMWAWCEGGQYGVGEAEKIYNGGNS